MPKIQRTGRAPLKRIAAGGDVLQMQLGTSSNQIPKRLAIAFNQLADIRVDPIKKSPIPNQRHLHRFRCPIAPLTWRQRA